MSVSGKYTQVSSVLEFHNLSPVGDEAKARIGMELKQNRAFLKQNEGGGGGGGKEGA